MNKWYVLCLDDAGEYVFATHKAFTTVEAARQYLSGVARERNPVIMHHFEPVKQEKEQVVEPDNEISRCPDRQTMMRARRDRRDSKYLRMVLDDMDRRNKHEMDK